MSKRSIIVVYEILSTQNDKHYLTPWHLFCQYQVNIWNRYAALENLDSNVDINRAWKLRENIRISSSEILVY
jgi:hypothetical protein